MKLKTKEERESKKYYFDTSYGEVELSVEECKRGWATLKIPDIEDEPSAIPDFLDDLAVTIRKTIGWDQNNIDTYYMRRAVALETERYILMESVDKIQQESRSKILTDGTNLCVIATEEKLEELSDKTQYYLSKIENKEKAKEYFNRYNVFNYYKTEINENK